MRLVVVNDDERIDSVVITGVEWNIIRDERRTERVAERPCGTIGDSNSDRATVNVPMVYRDVPKEPSVALDNRGSLGSVACHANWSTCSSAPCDDHVCRLVEEKQSQSFMT